MSSVDTFPKWCSHTPMWIPILHDNRECHVNLFNRCASLLVDPTISTSARSIISSSQRCLFHPSPSCLCFFHPPSLCFLQGLRFLNQVSFDSCEVSPFFSFMFLPGDSHEDSNGASSSSLFTRFLLRWIQIKLSVLISYPFFLVSNTFSCRCTSLSFTSRYSIVPEC